MSVVGLAQHLWKNSTIVRIVSEKPGQIQRLRGLPNQWVEKDAADRASKRHAKRKI
jgi:hypothetical protein